MFKGLANLGSLLKQAQQMGSKMQEINAGLKAIRVTGSAGGGLVEVEANGLGEVLRLSIDPTLIARQDRELIEDLVPAAVNQVIAKAREEHMSRMRDLTGGMELPGLDEALKSMTGGPGGDQPGTSGAGS